MHVLTLASFTGLAFPGFTGKLHRVGQHRQLYAQGVLHKVCAQRGKVALQGTQIEASVWRELADKYYDLLEEGKVNSSTPQDKLTSASQLSCCDVAFGEWQG